MPSRPRFPSHRRLAGLGSLLLAALLAAAPARAADITERADLRADQVAKLGAVTMIGTSALNPNRDLGNKQALIGAELRKRLKARGVEVTPVGVRQDDPDPQATFDKLVAQQAPGYALTLTVPQGTVFVHKLSGQQIAAKSYVVHVELINGRTGQLAWEYTADVEAVFGASNAQVAEAIVARMVKDGLL